MRDDARHAYEELAARDANLARALRKAELRASGYPLPDDKPTVAELAGSARMISATEYADAVHASVWARWRPGAGPGSPPVFRGVPSAPHRREAPLVESREVEDRLVDALLTVAADLGSEERAARGPGPGYRSAEAAEAARLVEDHGLQPQLVVPLRGLARSRGIPLEQVLRAWMRGELREVVKLPAATRGKQL